MAPWDPAANALFLELIVLSDSTARQAVLDRADSKVRAQVEALLAAAARASDFLERPEAESAPTASVAPNGQRTESLAAAPGPQLGTHIGPYKLLQEIGEGGMGTVYMAEQTEPVRRMVALKLIKPGMDTRQVLTRFEAERQAIALMDHPNIAKVLHADTAQTGRPYFVMELVKGIPLTRYCDEKRLTPRERLELFIPVCQAVQHAHQKGIIHRDLKPSNILVAQYDGRPVPKIIDFGVAKATGPKLTDKTMFTGFGAVVGTPEYMSPEQAELNQLDIDTRSDIYSLGVLLYELLTGTTPLQRKRMKEVALLEILRLVREQEPPRPSTRLSTTDELPSIAANRGIEPKRLTGLIRGDLDWIVMKCLEKTRDRRYETANGLALDIQRYLRDEVVSARPPTTGYRVRKFLRKNRRGVAAAAVVVFGLVGGTTAATLGWASAARARDAERDARVEVEGQRDRAVRAEADARANERAAREEAAIALAIRQFLTDDLLELADVRNQAEQHSEVNPKLTVREALDRAAARVGGRFHGQELTEASVRMTIGQTYLGLSEPVVAIPHLERSVALYRAHRGLDHHETLYACAVLGTCYDWGRRTADAVALLEDSLQRAEKALGPTHKVTHKLTHDLAGAYKDAKRLPDSIRLYEQVVRVDLARVGPTHRDTLTSQNNLASAYERAGRSDEALLLFEEILARRRQSYGTDDPDTLLAMNNLARAYWKADRLDLSIPLFEECLRRRLVRVGPDNALTIRTQGNLGINYGDAGRLDEAARELEQALARARKHPDPKTVMLFEIGQALTEMYSRARRHAEAEPLFREKLDQVRKETGDGSVSTAQYRAALGRNLVLQGKYAEAELLLREVLAVREKALPNSWVTPYTKSMLGEALRGQGKYAEAEPLLLAGYEGVTARASQIPATARLLRLGDVVDGLVRLYEATSNPEQAAAWARKRPPEAGPKPRQVK